MSTSPKRLLIRPGAIGDFIVSLPALQHLKSPHTEVWCSKQNLPLARFAYCSRSIEASGLNRIGILHANDVFQHLRAFDEIYCWYGTANPEFREAVAQFPFHFFPAIPPAGTPLNATQFFCDQVGAIDSLPVIDTGSPPREDFVILHPFASSPAKRWPLEHFKQLAALLAPITRVAWCAGPQEPLENATRIDDLFKLAQWISTARAYVGNDSGITHLAAAANTPVVALFGSTDPVIWAPRGEKIRVLARTPLYTISPQDAFAALAGLL